MTTGRLPWCLARERRHGSSSWCHRGVTSPERRDDEVVVDVDARGVAHGLARGAQFGDVLRAQRERVLTRLVGRPEREGLPRLVGHLDVAAEDLGDLVLPREPRQPGGAAPVGGLVLHGEQAGVERAAGQE